MKRAIFITGNPQTGKTTLATEVREKHRLVGYFDLDLAMWHCCDIGKMGRVKLQAQAEMFSKLAERIDVWKVQELSLRRYLENCPWSTVLLDGYHFVWANFAGFYRTLVEEYGFEVSAYLTSGSKLMSNSHPLAKRMIGREDVAPRFPAGVSTYQAFGPRQHSDSAKKLKLLQFPDVVKDGSVLDLGCAEGFFCFEALVSGARMVTGMDVDVKRLAFAEEVRNSLCTPVAPISFLRGSFMELSPVVRSYDVVLALSCLHYAKDWKAALDAVSYRTSKVLVFEGPLWPEEVDEPVTIDGNQFMPSMGLFMAELKRRFKDVKVVGESIHPKWPASWDLEQVKRFKHARRVVIHCIK